MISAIEPPTLFPETLRLEVEDPTVDTWNGKDGTFCCTYTPVSSDSGLIKDLGDKSV